MKKNPKLERLNICCCRVKTVLLLAAIPLGASSAVCIFKNPRRSFGLILPLNRAPAMILFWMVFPSRSLATPILLEKNGCDSRLSPKLSNKSLFWIKNCLFSGSLTSNRVRLMIWSSTSTCEKSGCKVRSKIIPSPILSFASPPNEKSLLLSLASKSLAVIPLMKGIRATGVLAWGNFFSNCSVFINANPAMIWLRGTLAQVEMLFSANSDR